MASAQLIVSAEAANTIVLTGTVNAQCSISVTPDSGASVLDISTPGSHNVNIGTVLQNCNKPAGYTLSVTSANCVTGTAGAKLVESASGTSLPISLSASNPTTGGSAATVTGLLATACTGQIMRDVTGALINSQTSTLSVAFTGSNNLVPGTYQDTVTVAMTTK